jgi:hypothetical protein
MAKPGRHTFPDFRLPGMIRKRTAREIKASALAAETLKKQTAREMREGARNSKRVAVLERKRIRLQRQMEIAFKRDMKRAGFEDPQAYRDSLELKANGAKMGRQSFPPPEVVDPNVELPRRVRIEAAIADAYYRHGDPKSVTVLRIKRAIEALQTTLRLLDNLYPV